jgi:hypothetical protein
MKACEQCGAPKFKGSRVNIDDAYKGRPFLYKLVCVLMIYLPLISLPFVLLSAWATYIHLKLLGGQNIRPFKSFLPDRKTHRYNLKSQVTMEPGFWFSPIRSKLFWIGNCTWYCPFSVGLFEWHAYLLNHGRSRWCLSDQRRPDIAQQVD